MDYLNYKEFLKVMNRHYLGININLYPKIETRLEGGLQILEIFNQNNKFSMRDFREYKMRNKIIIGNGKIMILHTDDKSQYATIKTKSSLINWIKKIL